MRPVLYTALAWGFLTASVVGPPLLAPQQQQPAVITSQDSLINRMGRIRSGIAAATDSVTAASVARAFVTLSVSIPSTDPDSVDQVYMGFVRRAQARVADALAAGMGSDIPQMASLMGQLIVELASETVIKGRRIPARPAPPPPPAPQPEPEPVDICVGWQFWEEPTIWEPAGEAILTSPQFWAEELSVQNDVHEPVLGMDQERQLMNVFVDPHIPGTPFLCSDTDGRGGFPSCSNPTEATIAQFALERGACNGCWTMPFSRLVPVANRDFKVKLAVTEGSAYYNMFPSTDYVVFIPMANMGGPGGMYPYVNFRPKTLAEEIASYPDATKARIRRLQAERTAMAAVNVADWDLCVNFEPAPDGRLRPVPCRTPDQRMRGVCVIYWSSERGLYTIVRVEDIDPSITNNPGVRP